MKLIDDIYCYIWQDWSVNNCNSYFIDGEVPLLIDPGLANYTKQLFDKMQKDNIDYKKIKLVIATHIHPDHFLGIADINNEDLKIAISKEDKDFLDKVGERFFKIFGLRLPSIQFDFLLKEGELKLKDKLFNIFLTPGHSPGSISIYCSQYKTLICGDVIFEGSCGRCDFPGGDANLLKASIDNLSKLDIEYLLPGHGEIIIGKEKINNNFEFVKETYFRYL